MHTKAKLENLEKQKAKTLEKMRFHDIAHMKKMTQRRLMLDAM